MKRVSVILPAYNEQDHIGQAVESVKQQKDFPREDYEIIVVDNGSHDQTKEIALKTGAMVISEPQKGANFARLAGIKQAQGDIVVLLDADNIAPPHWLESLVQIFEARPEVVAIGGGYDVVFPSRLLRLCAKILQHTFERVLPPILRLFFGKPTAFLYGGNLAARKGALVKSIDTRFSVKNGDDVAISLALAAQGKVLFKPALAVQSSSRRWDKEGVLKVQLRYLWVRFYVYFLNRPARLPKWLA